MVPPILPLGGMLDRKLFCSCFLLPHGSPAPRMREDLQPQPLRPHPDNLHQVIRSQHRSGRDAASQDEKRLHGSLGRWGARGAVGCLVPVLRAGFEERTPLGGHCWHALIPPFYWRYFLRFFLLCSG